MLKINKSLIVNLEDTLQVHPQIEVEVFHMINVWECYGGEIESTVELVDHTIKSFMGEPLRMIDFDEDSKYKMHQRYRDMIYDLGIDLDELVDDAAVGSIPSALVKELENDFRIMQINKFKVNV
tara:strand:- start:817 stop:1188 length:372 start_codon:yes stop_codon:yes gene_type:complete